MSKIMFVALILVLVGISLMCLFLISSTVLAAVSPAVGSISMLGCMLSVVCIIAGACMMALMRRQIVENKRQKVVTYINEHINQYRQQLPGWSITYNFIVGQRSYMVRNRSRRSRGRGYGRTTYSRRTTYYLQGQIIFTRQGTDGQPMMNTSPPMMQFQNQGPGFNNNNMQGSQFYNSNQQQQPMMMMSP